MTWVKQHALIIEPGGDGKQTGFQKLSDEDQEIYDILNDRFAANGHAHTGNGSDGALLDASNLSYSPSGNISATTIPSAIAELDIEKASIAQLQNFSFVGQLIDLITKGPVIDVRSFGADPTGATSSDAAIQSAIDSNVTGIIYLPKGTYLISNPIVMRKYGQHLLGDGIDATTLKASTTISNFIYLYELNDGVTINSAVGRISISGITFDGDNKATDGIYSENLRYNNEIQRVFIKKVTRHGINYAEDCYINNVRNCQMQFCGGAGVYVGINGNAIHITENDISYCGYGIEINGGATIVNGVSINANCIQACTNAGVYATGTAGSISIISNYFEDNETTTINLDSASITSALVLGNNIVGKVSVSDYNIINKGKNTSIIGNFFSKGITAQINHQGSRLFAANNRIDTGAQTLVSGTSLRDSYVIDLEADYPTKINGRRVSYSTFSAAPSSGTWTKGDIVYNSDPDAAEYIGWVATSSGTFGTLSGITGSITSGLTALTVNSTSGLSVGMYITIAGVSGTKKITAISGLNVTIDTAAGATVSTAAIAYFTPVWKGFGTIQS